MADYDLLQSFTFICFLMIQFWKILNFLKQWVIGNCFIYFVICFLHPQITHFILDFIFDSIFLVHLSFWDRYIYIYICTFCIFLIGFYMLAILLIKFWISLQTYYTYKHFCNKHLNTTHKSVSYSIWRSVFMPLNLQLYKTTYWNWVCMNSFWASLCS